MNELSELEKKLLSDIADLHAIPEGAYNIRENGKLLSRNSTAEVNVVSKTEKSGIDIVVAPNVKGRSVHIPVLVTAGGLNDLVYNDFYIGEGADVLIVAGCGIHNDSSQKSGHDGIHTFHLGKNCRVRYVEKHIGTGIGLGEKVLNPTTKIIMRENSYFEMETVQISGVSNSVRKTDAKLYAGAELIIKEKILTTEKQRAITEFKVNLLGENTRVDVTSRSVAKDNSYQDFRSTVVGKASCFGHVACDGILIGNAVIRSTPKISAENVNATLVHEAAIGKIAGDQMLKLMTLGLSETEAENLIIKGFIS